jgi:hypothetical protein
VTTKQRLLFAIQIVFAASLLVFSYSYVDLNLTLSNNPFVLSTIKNLQFLAYYQRPVATLIYFSYLLLWFSFFALEVYLFYKKRLSAKFLKLSVLFSVIILIFAYPYLSSDLFNYMFDAKIIYVYHKSPYLFKALDFPHDDWIRFMRWVHRYSPYGPLWLLFSLVPTILGFGKFVITLFTFKIFIGSFQLINTYFVYKIVKRINAQKALLAGAIYGLNPLFLIEGVANAHNDIVIATCFLASIYFAVKRKTVFSYIALMFGVFIKYIPILIAPWLILYNIRPQNNFKKLVYLSFATMVLFTFVYSTFKIVVPFVSGGSTQVQFQPWYLFWTLPFLALVPGIIAFLVVLLVSFFASLRYYPYLLNGDWSQPGTIIFLKEVIIIPLIMVAIMILIKNGYKFLRKTH